jgi:hypothetical protein
MAVRTHQHALIEFFLYGFPIVPAVAVPPAYLEVFISEVMKDENRLIFMSDFDATSDTTSTLVVDTPLF